jgi:wyosine [tRNA(Phe)-imidazoG37] synthetase (radical SAM superfamily)
MKKYVFGPVNSRRFGISLGIDLSPEEKKCNFDCLYCEVGKTFKKTQKIEKIDTKILKNEIEDALKKYPHIEVITVTANGEPTLCKNIAEVTETVNRLKNGKKTVILSNSSTVAKKEIKDILKKYDIVKLSLDCATEQCFKKIDRPEKDIKLSEILKGVTEFAREFENKLVIEIMVVSKINDNFEEFKKLNEILQQIKPARVDLSTIDRPPAYNVKGVLFEKLFQLGKAIRNIPFSIAVRKDEMVKKFDFSKEEILKLISLRPVSKTETSNFSPKTQNIISKLIKEKKIKTKYVANLCFYVLCK